MPTENRSSNTEMVNVPPYIGLEPLVGLYYPAQCRRCGWVGSSEELTEDDAQCTRDVGDRLCLGDCDELGRDDLLGIIQAMAKAQPHQGEPVVLPARKDPTQGWAVPGGVAKADGWNEYQDEIAKLGPLYTHADPAEVERLVAANAEYARRHIEQIAEVEQLRAALKFYADREHYHVESGNWDTVSGEPLNILWCGDEPDFIEDGTVARHALSASAEPSGPAIQIPEGYCVMPRRLTAENGAKALLLGEFKLEVTRECPECAELEEPAEGCEICDGEGEYGQRHTIPWDKIKFIYSEAVRGLELKQ